MLYRLAHISVRVMVVEFEMFRGVLVNRIVVSLILVVFTMSVSPVEVVETPDGRKVRLKDDYTWEYVEKSEKAAHKKPWSVNKNSFTRPSTANTQLKGAKLKYSVWFDSSSWKRNKNKQNDQAEYEFMMTDATAFGMVIAEDLTFDFEFMEQNILEHAADDNKNPQLISHEHRTVNGRKMGLIIFDVTFQQNAMRFYTYLYSSKNMTIQLHAFCPKKAIGELEPKILQFLNGLEVYD